MKTAQIDSFMVVGRQARTSNAKEMSGAGVIGQMWSKGVPSGSPVVAVYSQYESDKDGEYNYLLGEKKTSDETLPPATAYCVVLSGTYLHLRFEGPISPESVMGLWRQIWEAEHVGTIQRAYQTDFEVYGEAGFDLYVGVKSLTAP
jgi:predicted transcriptional regulator YdeE